MKSLFPLPSFLDGIASVIDLGGVYEDFEIADDPARADYEAILSDWQAVGDDIRAASASIRLE